MHWLDRQVSRVSHLWCALLVMVCLALPGFFTVPPIDRDEVRFSQSSAQMLASGDLIDIRLDEDVRYKKPVGIYWLQATSAAITGHPQAIWSYRLVSLLGAMISVGFTYAIARIVVPRQGAFLAATLLAASFMLGAEARLAKTDAMLLATILASQYVLARAYLPMGRAQSISLNAGQVFLFWFALGAGILIKGPIGPMVVGLTCAGLCVLRRDFAILRSLRPFRGLVLVLAMILPWLIAISVKSDGAFWAKSLGEDMLAKVGTGQESHGAPPGTYIALLWFTFWPGSVILAGLLPRLWVRRRNPVVSFALAWILPTWVIFELTATKLIHYVLPVYPALALLIAFGVVHARLSRWSVGISGVLAVIPAILLAAFYFQAQTLGADVGIYFWLGAGGVLGASVLVVVALHKGTQSVLALALAWGGLSLSTALYPSVARMDVLWPAKQVAALAQTVPNCSLSIVGYQEPSLIFLTQRRAKFDTPQMSQARFTAPGCVIAVVEEAELAAFSALVSQAKPTQVIKGFNIGQGRMITLHVFENN